MTEIGKILDFYSRKKFRDWERLAEAAGVDHHTVSRIMQGVSRPRPQTLDKICKALDIQDNEVCDLLFLAYGLSSPAMQKRAVEQLQKKMPK